MPAQHVFVETNWVVDLVAPALSRNPGASELLERSRRGELSLHVPAIALSEAHKVVRERRLRVDLENLRAFVRDTRDAGGIDEATANSTFDLLSRFQNHVANEKLEAPKRIAALLQDRAVDVFPLDEVMLSAAPRSLRRPGWSSSRLISPFSLRCLFVERRYTLPAIKSRSVPSMRTCNYGTETVRRRKNSRVCSMLQVSGATGILR